LLLAVGRASRRPEQIGKKPNTESRQSIPLELRAKTAMLDLHKQLAAAKMPHGRTAIQRQIDATDRRIDELVYELYGLRDEEIAIVEAGI